MNQEDRAHLKPENTERGLAGSIVTRRRLLQQAGCVIAAAAVSPTVAGATEQAVPVAPIAGKPAAVSAVMDKLSAYMSEAHARALPGEVAEKAKHHILDTSSVRLKVE